MANPDLQGAAAYSLPAAPLVLTEELTYVIARPKVEAISDRARRDATQRQVMPMEKG
jgi:hypothetical protein